MTDKSELVVVKHNAVVESCYSLSIFESRIILGCIAQINSMGGLSKDDQYTLVANEIIESAGLSSKNSYNHLKKAVDRLYERSVIIKLDDDKTLKTRWISGAVYEEGLGLITIRFAQDITPYLSDLTKNFTKYKLNNILLFKSGYSVRIYELLMRWQGSTHTAEIDWLKEKFELQGKYTRLLNFKARVIDPAIKEINDHSDVAVSYTDVKRGRTVTGFKFEWHPKKTTKVKTHQPKKTMTPAQYERLNQQRCIGKSEAEVRAMIREDASNTERAIKHGVKSATHTQGMKDINSVLAGVIPHKKG